jgi:hypothetical protein
VFEYALSGFTGWFSGNGVTGAIAGSAVFAAYLILVPFERAGIHPYRLFVASTVMPSIILLLGSGLLSAVHLLSLEASSHQSNVIWNAVFVWALGTTFWLGFSMASRARIRAGVGLIVISILAGITLPSVPIFRSMMTERGDFSLLQTVVDALPTKPLEPTHPPLPRIDVEATLHRQHELLGHSLSKLQAPTTEQGALYYIGMAPYSEQDVFIREVEAVKTLFDDRFGTQGRSLNLINHRRTHEHTPLATTSNLDVVLSHIGKMMRPERDVLFLFVTSHGSKGQIGVSFPSFPLNSLTPDRLLAALDRAGIKNRVLVLSACHSGSFIPSLQNENTLILAAAHAEKTSFGCSNENEWTYFGDAYFNQALRTETSFVAAFDKASATIKSWEQRDGLEASEPQISLGSGIRATLEAMSAARPPSTD